jgi:hypothetical protein
MVVVPVNYFLFAVIAAVYVCDTDHKKRDRSAVQGYGNVAQIRLYKPGPR